MAGVLSSSLKEERSTMTSTTVQNGNKSRRLPCTNAGVGTDCQISWSREICASSSFAGDYGCASQNWATPSGCRRRPWPWLCHGADASAADPASLDLRFSKAPSRTPFQDHSKIDMGFGSESQRRGRIFEAFLGSPRPLKMCIMSTDRFEN